MKESAPSLKADFPERFRAWFDDWGEELWILCVRSARSNAQAEQDFAEVLDFVFRKSRARLRRAGGEAVAALFMREWFKVQRAKNSPPAPAELSGEDRALVAALFRADWDLARTSAVFGLSPKAIRYRTFQALVRLGGKPAPPSANERNCVRVDLRALDELLGLHWEDPLKLFGEKEYKAHISSCARCRDLERDLRNAAQSARSASLGVMPSASFAFLETGPGFSSRSFIFSWISTLPWYFRVPLQICCAAAVVFGVVAVPYLGDFFPELSRKMPEVSRRIRRAVDVSFDFPHRAPPSPAPLPPVAQTPKETVALAPIPSVAPVASSAPVAVAKTPAKPSPAPAAPVASAKATDAKVFFQWGAISKDAETVAPKILELLTRYSVERAGDLNLGARYLRGLYYHFNVNEADYERLVQEMSTLGLERFTRNRSRGIKDHPPGKTRVVFLLRGSGGKSKPKAAAPEAPADGEGGSSAVDEPPDGE